MLGLTFKIARAKVPLYSVSRTLSWRNWANATTNWRFSPRLQKKWSDEKVGLIIIVGLKNSVQRGSLLELSQAFCLH